VYEIMPEEMSRLRRASRKLDAAEGDQPAANLGIAVVDLDYFKRVNDTWDHSVGDAVLRGVAELFRRCSRDSDVVARWGGEEFLFILRDVRGDGLGEMAQRLLEAVRSSPIRVGDDISVDITCSVGYTPFPCHLPAAVYSWEDVLKVADTALYEAKQAGRDCAVGLVYDREVDPERMMALLTRDVQAAIAVGYLKRVRPEQDAAG
jgi:diguanylate cyclase (GGDEF)-like protein